MKILVVSVDYRPMFGGVATYTYNIAKSFHAQGSSIKVIAPNFKNSKEFDAKQKFETSRITNLPVIREISLFFHLLLNAGKYDIVYDCQWYPCGLLSYFVRLFTGQKYVIVTHGCEALDSETSFWKRMKKKFRWLRVAAYNNSILNIAVSHYTKGLLAGAGAKKEKLAVFNNGVDVNELKNAKINKNLKKQLGLEGKKIILSINRLEDYKGNDIVIKAMPEILKKVPNAVYLIGGSGYYKQVLEDLIKKYKLEDNVRLAGYIPEKDVPSYFSMCDVFAMISRINYKIPKVEGFGIVFLEAGYFRKPVIGGNSGGIPDAVLDNKTGLLVNPTAQKDVSSAVVRILKNKKLANKLGEAGHKLVVNELNWSNITKEILAALKQKIQ